MRLFPTQVNQDQNNSKFFENRLCEHLIGKGVKASY